MFAMLRCFCRWGLLVQALVLPCLALLCLCMSQSALTDALVRTIYVVRMILTTTANVRKAFPHAPLTPSSNLKK